MDIEDRQPTWRKALYCVVAAVLSVALGLYELLAHRSTASHVVGIALFVAAACQLTVARYYLK
jgi:hypothetical protein